MPSLFRVTLLLMLMTAWASEPGMTQATSFPAPLRLARIFQDGAVLQRDTRIPVWGWAPAEANVSVTLAGKAQNAVADAGGAWLVTFAALPAGGPHTLTVKSGTSALTVRDVMVGDVWIASGQSNMEWPLSRASNGAATVASAHDPLLREFSVPHTFAETPQADLEGGSWSPADAEHAGAFSAVAYFFARDLRAALSIPIGIIHTSWGGANVETWMSRQAQGINDSIWNAITAQGRRREAALRDALRARIGGLPAVDSGLVDGNPAWADITLDDSKWATVPVPLLWERGGYEGLDGVAWYRTTFSLSDAEARQDIRFALGKIDDDDITWVNGTEIGRTTGYAQTRFYGVPAGVLRTGLNVLAIRVADWGGGGGIYGDSSQVFMEIGSTRRSFPRNWKFKVGVASLGTDAQRINKVPSLLYNRMIYPLLRYPIKGAIWYQGESNANNDEQARAYRPLFAKLIESWRREWQGSASDFPFLWVQLPNYGPVDTVPPVTAGWAILRESQTAAVRLPNTGQVITIDVGEVNDIHPLNKEPVGRRLALIARRVAYGENILASGPRYQRHRISNGKVVIEFDDVGGGLVSGTPDLRGFAIAGADRRWVWANARIEGSSVVVSSAQVTNPVAVRYAWGNSPNNPSLYNREGLPAAPFRTDVW